MESAKRDEPIVLIVEDDLAHLAECAARVESLGYRVHRADSAEAGIRWVRDHHVDAVLTDNVLPGMTGVRSISEFAKWSKAPVLVMTSDSSGCVETDALLLGAAGFMKKPLDMGVLERQLRKSVAAGTSMGTR